MNFFSKNKIKMKIISMVFVFALFIPMILSGCNNSDAKGLDWSMTDETGLVSLSLSIQGDDANRILLLSYEEDIFTETISDSQIRVSGYDLTSDESADDEEDNQVTGWSFKRDSAKQITITMPEGEAGDYWGYMVVVHSSATLNKKFGEAWAFKVIEEPLEDLFD